jgi:D-sedoheptulose 7-phosphate isomerase
MTTAVRDNPSERRRAVFLDRDGIINPHVYNAEQGLVDAPANPAEFKLFPEVAQAIGTLKRLGFLVVIASNQPGVAKGKLSPGLLQAITDKMTELLAAGGSPLDGVYYCLHHPEALLAEYRVSCDCRKPRPGLLLRAAAELNIDLARSYMVGDGIVDVLAGSAVGAKTFFVNQRKCYVCDELVRNGARPDFLAANLAEVAELIESLERPGSAAPLESSRSRCAGVADAADNYTTQYLREAAEILNRIDRGAIEKVIELLVRVRAGQGRLFFLGVGGGAGHASHAVNDFRKIACIESYTPTDNPSELTAWVNDAGWADSYANWLRGSRLRAGDLVFVFSVGGGDSAKNISPNLVRALDYAKEVGATICGVVGRDGGYTARVADACVLIPVLNPATVTPHTESFQALVWHLLVSHPRLKVAEMKWESVK